MWQKSGTLIVNMPPLACPHRIQQRGIKGQTLATSIYVYCLTIIYSKVNTKIPRGEIEKVL
jgi:hypothetical protein